MELLIKLAGGMALGLVLGYLAKRKTAQRHDDVDPQNQRDLEKARVFVMNRAEKIIFYGSLAFFLPMIALCIVYEKPFGLVFISCMTLLNVYAIFRHDKKLLITKTKLVCLFWGVRWKEMEWKQVKNRKTGTYVKDVTLYDTNDKKIVKIPGSFPDLEVICQLIDERLHSNL